MAAQKGKDLLLKIDSDGAGTFTTALGLRSKSLSFNATEVDVTNSESANEWQELLDGAGIKSAGISGDGVFKDAVADETIRSIYFAQTIRDWQVIIPDFGTVEGPFKINALEFAGNHDGELTYTLGLASAGELTFTSA